MSKHSWVFVVASHRSGTNMLLNALQSGVSGISNLGEVAQTEFDDVTYREEVEEWRNGILHSIFGTKEFPLYVRPLWNAITPDLLVPDPWCVQKLIKALISGQHFHETGKMSTHHTTFLCKLLIQHCPPVFTPLWKWLYNCGVKIIYIKRDNPFHTVVSMRHAVNSGQWYVDQNDTVTPPEPFEIDKYQLLSDISFLDHCDAFFTSISWNSPNAIIVHYGNLCRNWNGEMKRVLRFIDIDHDAPLPQVSKKQITQDYESLVSNYDDLASYFGNTRFASHFE